MDLLEWWNLPLNHRDSKPHPLFQINCSNMKLRPSNFRTVWSAVTCTGHCLFSVEEQNPRIKSEDIRQSPGCLNHFSPNNAYYQGDITQNIWRLKLPSTRLIVQQFTHVNSNENFRDLLMSGIKRWPDDFPQKNQWCGKRLLTSSWALSWFELNHHRKEWLGWVLRWQRKVGCYDSSMPWRLINKVR